MTKKLGEDLNISWEDVVEFAEELRHNPEMRKLFRQSRKEKGFKKGVNKIYSEIKKEFKHGKAPK